MMVMIGDPQLNEDMIMNAVFSGLGWWIGIAIVSIFAGIIVEAGLFNMYKSCILNGDIESGTFKEGVKKYFLKFILADILMILAWVLLFIPYVIVGVVTLMAGFVMIPIVIAIFTTMWKVSMVMEDAKIFEGLKKSFRFAKLNFMPLGALVIFQNAFSKLSSGGSGSFNSNIGNWNSTKSPSTTSTPDLSGVGDIKYSFYEGYSQALPYIKTAIFIMIPVISIAVVVSSLIKMVFRVFFSLSIFVMYSENKTEKEPETKPELVKEVL